MALCSRTLELVGCRYAGGCGEECARWAEALRQLARSPVGERWWREAARVRHSNNIRLNDCPSYRSVCPLQFKGAEQSPRPTEAVTSEE
ncbi:hypothetical protein SKAU_G00130330 [Synaphobranchus kaupii]|uniref:Uncharacterized protein n=1 Tax=Synaphobranchus kaupii TaxID=118154 RepID=A0A9Q1J151_SYNKA|nr:hypothetical protein SKAU_G00130330 [Synaphobranchus kaupii]